MPVDFTHLQKRNKAYAGANGNKISVIYEGEQYMPVSYTHLDVYKRQIMM